MARTSQTLMGYVRSWLAEIKPISGSDGELLRRFIKRRDQVAFAELLDRHGPMILGLCRRLIGDSHLAEDVFQASFLVLARKGCSIRRPESLGAWLYGVAYRLALKARAKQRRQEPHPLSDRPATAPDPLDDISARELLSIIDDEMQQLPDTYRLPLIHCCLEGRSLEEAAQILGWTPGSVKGRLERGRSRLRERLTRHGLTLPAVLGPALFLASPSLAATLMQATLPLGSGVASSAAVSALADEAVRGFVAAKLKATLSTVLANGFLGIGVALSVWVESRNGEAIHQPPELSRIATPFSIFDDEAAPPTDRHVLPPGATVRLGTTQHRHPLARSVVFHPNGLAVNTIGEDGSVRTWQPSSGRLLADSVLPGDRQLDYSLSADGKLLMRIDGNRVEVWRLGHQPTISVHEFADLKKAILAADGNTFATIEGAAAGNVLNIHTLEPFTSRTLGKLASFPGDIAIAPDGQRAFTSIALDGLIRCWDGKPNGPAWSARFAAAKIAVSSDGQWLIAHPARRNERFRLYETATGRQSNELLPLAEGFGNAILSPDGTLFCCAGDKGVLVWDRRAARPIYQIPGEAHDVAFSPDGKALAAISGGIAVYEVGTGKPIFDTAIDKGHTTPVMGMAWSPDGKRLVSHAMLGRNDVLLWDVAGATPRRVEAAFRTIAHTAFSRDGERITALTHDGQAQLLDAWTGKEISQCGLVAFSGDRSFDAALSRHGRRAVLRFDRGEQKPVPLVVSINPISGGNEREIALPDRFGRKVFLSSDGRALFNPRGEQFDPESQQALPPLQLVPDHILGEKAVCSARGELIAIPVLTSGNERARDGVAIWERATGQLLTIVPSRDAFGTIALSPDGGILAVGQRNRVILWETATGNELARLELPPRPTSITDDWFSEAIAFSPDGRRLATGHFDSTILLWDVPARRVPRLQPAEAWNRLGDEIAKAAPAIEYLAGNRTLAIELLRDRIKPAGPNDATARPRTFDPATVPTGDRLRTQRGIAILERFSDGKSTLLLEELSRGDPASRSTREAKAALDRLSEA